jgi:diguanylate cyclase (GGDEF)-like protein
MSPGRFQKALARQFVISWREQPSQGEIEALEANVERVGLVVRLRWAIVAAIAIFSAASIAIYAVDQRVGDLWRQMIVPAIGLVLVLVYNAYYQRNYRRFGNLAVFNVVQLGLDIAVVTVLIYYSGGVYSWFDAMYFLFVLEAALILPTRRQVWAVAGAAAFAYSAVLALVYAGILPHMAMPFVANDLQHASSYVAVRGLWTVTVIFGTATVGTLFVTDFRTRLDRLASQSIRDPRTGLYNRSYARRELAVEIERAKLYGRGVSVILADIDDFEHFNVMFGVEAGNAMLVKVAEAVRSASGCIEGEPCLTLAARYGGEEFAIIVPGDPLGAPDQAIRMAQDVRAFIGSTVDEDRSVTVSVGMATYPTDGRTASELLGAADVALVRAATAGGNRVESGRGSGSDE